MSTIRVGPNVHPKARAGQDWSAAEKSYFPGFLQQLNPSAMLQMGYGKSDFYLALGWRELLPNTTVIYRQYHDAEGHLFELLSPYDYVKGMKLYTDPRIPLYILNETNSKAPLDELKRNINWRIEVMRILALEGQPHVIGNEGPGQPHMSWFKDVAKWEVVQPFFQQFKINPFASWGLHPYWGGNGLRPSEGQSARFRDIAIELENHDMPMPSVYLTEVGRDRYGDSKVNGWRSTGVSEEVFADEIIEAQETLWNEKYIKGAMVFSYGSTTSQWWPFDIMGAFILHSKLIEANKRSVDNQTPTPPAAKPPFVPIPADLSGMVEVTVDNAAYPLTATPNAAAKNTVGTLTIGERIRLYRSTHTLDSQFGSAFQYHWCERVSTPLGESPYGWTTYPMPVVPEPPPVVVPPTPPTTDTALQRMLKTLDEIESHEAAVEEHYAAIDVLRAELKRLANEARALADAA